MIINFCYGSSRPPYKTMVPDNSKRNLHNFYMKKEEHVQLFHTDIKTKEDEIIIFCRIHDRPF